MHKIFHSVFSTFLNFFYPPICPGCSEEIKETQRLTFNPEHSFLGGGILCFDCYQKLFTSSLAVCPKCGRPVPHFTKCKECEPELGLSRIRALGLYQKPFMGVIEEFKYRGKVIFGKILGDALSLLLAYDPILKDTDLLVPIPLHSARFRERGYNQSEILAGQVAKRTKVPIALCLWRKKNTKSQTKLSPPERFKNLKDAFVFKSGYEITGKKITLIDDVATTGATLSSAGEVLKAKGAKEVYGLVVAKG